MVPPVPPHIDATEVQEKCKASMKVDPDGDWFLFGRADDTLKVAEQERRTMGTRR